MNTSLMRTGSTAYCKRASSRQGGLIGRSSSGSAIRGLLSSASQIWVAARGSFPLHEAYRYNPNDAEICALPGTGLRIEARCADGKSRDITSEARYSVVDARIARLSDHGTIIGVRTGSTMLDICYHGFKTRVVVNVIERSAKAYSSAIQVLASRMGGGCGRWHGQVSGCLNFVEDALKIMGLDLPSKTKITELSRWISCQEAHKAGWYEVKDAMFAQRLADLGHPVLAVTRQSVKMITPSSDCVKRKNASSVLAELFGRKASLIKPLKLADMVCCYVHV